MDYALRFIAVLALLLTILSSATDAFGFGSIQNRFISTRTLGIVFAIWAFVIGCINSAKAADTFFTYGCRTRSKWRTITGGFAFSIVMLFWLAIIFFSFGSATSFGNIYSHWLKAIVGPCSLVLLALYFRRGIRDIRFDRRYGEGGFASW
jgi:hypothetical protein